MRKLLGIIDLIFVGSLLLLLPLPLFVGFTMSFDSPYTTVWQVLLYLGLPVLFLIAMLGLIGIGGVLLLKNKLRQGNLLAGIGYVPFALLSLVLVIQSQLNLIFVGACILMCFLCIRHFFLFAKIIKKKK